METAASVPHHPHPRIYPPAAPPGHCRPAGSSPSQGACSCKRARVTPGAEGCIWASHPPLLQTSIPRRAFHRQRQARTREDCGPASWRPACGAGAPSPEDGLTAFPVPRVNSHTCDGLTHHRAGKARAFPSPSECHPEPAVWPTVPSSLPGLRFGHSEAGPLNSHLRSSVNCPCFTCQNTGMSSLKILTKLKTWALQGTVGTLFPCF